MALESEPMRGRRSTAWALRSVVLAVVVAASTSVTSNAQDDAYKPPHDRPGPAADKVYFTQFDVDRAPLEIQAGNMDVYLYGLKTEAAQELEGTEGIELIHAPATTLSLILNPAPAPEGELNPFSIPEVRRAMQYLVDRDLIAQDIYRGAAAADDHARRAVGPRLPDRLRHRPRLRASVRPGVRPPA